MPKHFDPLQQSASRVHRMLPSPMQVLHVRSGYWQRSPAQQDGGPQASPWPTQASVVVVAIVVVLAGEVVVLVFVVVGVVVVAQPPCAQASQQLAKLPTHACPPPFGAAQRAASRLIAHAVRPWTLVRQQVTKPGLPHVDLLAQRSTAPAQVLSARTALACAAAQATYAR
jgi:hypothetical protein